MATMNYSNDVTKNRHEYIGASDIGVIMGVGLFKTPFELWCEKTQKIKPEISKKQQEIMDMGNLLEDVIAQKYASEHNVSVRRSPKVYVHPKYSYIRAHADRIITGSERGLECKNTSEYMADKWNGADIPEQYILQCQLCMGLSGRKEWDIAVLIGGNKYKDKSLKFDKDLYDLMIEKAVDFWQNNVLRDVPPALTADDNKVVRDLYPDNNGNLLDISEIDSGLLISFEDAVAQRQELSMHKKQIEEELNELDAKIKDVIKTNDGILTPKYKVTWKNQKGQIRYDKEQMIADGVYDKYASQGINRVLRISVNKESEVA